LYFAFVRDLPIKFKSIKTIALGILFSKVQKEKRLTHNRLIN
jgi:hypothetical protein